MVIPSLVIKRICGGYLGRSRIAVFVIQSSSLHTHRYVWQDAEDWIHSTQNTVIDITMSSVWSDHTVDSIMMKT